jgi:hypothetical protein
VILIKMLFINVLVVKKTSIFPIYQTINIHTYDFEHLIIYFNLKYSKLILHNCFSFIEQHCTINHWLLYYSCD